MLTCLKRVVLVLCLMLPALASGKQSCDLAETSLPPFDASKRMFSELFNYYAKYGTCLDGDLAERAATVVTESLDKAWSQLSDLARLSKKDKGFKKFILTSIEPAVTGQEAEVRSIITRSQKKCPKSFKSLCSEIGRACKDSLKSD